MLVVDDDDGLRAFVSELLRRAGHEVTAASCVTEAISALESEPIDVVLTDVIMPERRGVELAAVVEELEVGIVFMSGYATDMLFEHQEPLRGAILIEKPFELQGVLEAVNLAYLRSRSSGPDAVV